MIFGRKQITPLSFVNIRMEIFKQFSGLVFRGLQEEMARVIDRTQRLGRHYTILLTFLMWRAGKSRGAFPRLRRTAA